jgi:single-stranded-DNA-specific exonuclease
MLVKRLQALGACVQFYIPLRHSEGYGMNEQVVRKLKERGVSLMITVDNGVSAFDEIALCGALGIDVVVTDHPSVGKALPDCAAVVAVSRKDSLYPNRCLCGAGVALKLIQALTNGDGSDEELALAAVATVADVVPLVGENRMIASLGIERISGVPGFAALLDAAGFQQEPWTNRRFRLSLRRGSMRRDAWRRLRRVSSCTRHAKRACRRDCQAAQRI